MKCRGIEIEVFMRICSNNVDIVGIIPSALFKLRVLTSTFKETKFKLSIIYHWNMSCLVLSMNGIENRKVINLHTSVIHLACVFTDSQTVNAEDNFISLPTSRPVVDV